MNLPGSGAAAMAESQLLCMDDNTVNENITENKPQFYYSEGQRAALEELLRDGDSAFKNRLQDDGVKDFLCAREVKLIRETFREYEADRNEKRERAGSKAERSTYWPELSDTAVPPLDIGWSDGAKYKGMTRVNIYTHPPKEREPFIKEVVRKLIQESRKVGRWKVDDITIYKNSLWAVIIHYITSVSESYSPCTENYKEFLLVQVLS